MLAGHLTIPPDATGIVVFVHGSGSSRHSPRNRFVASQLNEAGLGTLLFDLLTSTEELDRVNVFDIETLATRLTAVTRWLRGQPGLPGLADRLLRCEHGRGGGAVGSGRADRRHRRRRVAEAAVRILPRTGWRRSGRRPC